MATIPVAMAELAVGQVIKVSKMGLQQLPCVQLRCRQMDYSSHLHHYFAKYTDLWALDADAKAQMGDTILIRRSDPKVLKTTSDVQHVVERVVFKFGVVIDPVTKQRAVRGNWADQLAMKKSLIEEIVETPANDTPTYSERRQTQKELIEKHSSSTPSDAPSPS